jgi:hypothetical protein
MVVSTDWENHEVPPPQGTVIRQGQPLLEDLRHRPGTSVFRFSHAPENPDSVNVIRDMIYREDDVVCWLLRVFLTRCFGPMIFALRDSVLDCATPRDNLVR